MSNDPKRVADDKGWPEMPEEIREDLHGKWSKREELAYWHGRAVSDAWGVNAIDRLKDEHRAEVERLTEQFGRMVARNAENQILRDKARDQVARVEALADELETERPGSGAWRGAYRNNAKRIRAALAEPERDEEGNR